MIVGICMFSHMKSSAKFKLLHKVYNQAKQVLLINMYFCISLDHHMHANSDYYSNDCINNKSSRGRKLGCFPLNEDFPVLCKYDTVLPLQEH